jgi:glutaminyl-peptide cyclotransferase
MNNVETTRSGIWPVRRLWWGVLAVAVAGGLLCGMWTWTAGAAAPVFGYQIVREYPHDPQAYCQGLVFDQGHLYEGTGHYGQSSLRRVRLETGEVLQNTPLDRRYFGEGIVVFGDRIIQLTWRERTALVYDKQTLQLTGQAFRYSGEGWGLTTDGQSLIMSDGTSVLRFLDPRTFEVTRRITVHDGRRRIANLNELEYVQGEIFANVWQEDYLLRISPRNGVVTGRVDLRGLQPVRNGLGDDSVLNGIAYDSVNDRLFVTGKNWPVLYEIRLMAP